MIPQLILINDEGKYTYLYDNQYADLDFVVSNINGLRWGENELAITDNVYTDGDNIQNAKGMPRIVEIELKPIEGKGDYSALYDRFSTFLDEKCSIRWVNRKTADGVKEVQTDDVVMVSCEAPTNEQDTRLTMTFHCPNPFWYDINSTSDDNPGTRYTTIKGTAPPTNIEIVAENVVIPANTPLEIGGWKLQARGSDISANVLFLRPYMVWINSVERLDVVASPMSPRALGKKVRVERYESGSTTAYPFSIGYNAQYY